MLQGIPVVCHDKATEYGCPFLIGVRKEYEDEIVNQLIEDRHKIYLSLDKLIVDEMHLMSRVDFEREICALSHIDSMDSYFEIAETNEALDFFWNEQGDCYPLFCTLDLSNVVELACGRGRAFFHHSNGDADYKASYDKGVESRSFMSAKIFAYLAYRAGFEIEEQHIVDWIHPGLDCLTLVVKR